MAARDPRGGLVSLPPPVVDPLSALESGAAVPGWVQAPDGRALPVTIRLGAPPPAVPLPAVVAPAAPEPAEPGDEAFRLRLELDVTHEQLVLFRTLLVLEALGGLLLLRQWMLGS